MARRLFRRRMPRRVTCRWLLRGKKTRPPPHSSSPDYSSLPDEIQEQILLKLQCINSTVTCTCVCKSWHALIKSRSFISMHLSRSHSDPEYFLCSYFRLCHSIRCYNSEKLESYRGLIFPERRVRIHGSCNGLICYTELDNVFSDIYLWNPTIRKLKILPKSKYSSKEATAYNGFWYDTDSDDYKVAKIFCRQVCEVEVYSLSSNSWDIITIGGPSYSVSYFKNVVHFNGTFYLLTSFRKFGWYWRRYWSLISLNIKDGMFRDTLLWPAEESKSNVVFDQMLGAAGRVVVSFSFLNPGTQGTGIHVYDENLNQLYRDEPESSGKEFLLPLGVRSSGNEVLFQKLGSDVPILAFDVGELRFKKFCSSAKTIFRAIPFVETLVLLDDGDSRSLPHVR